MFNYISVILIDFQFEGKPGEKSLRSLDQVTYQDGINRARSSTLKDSYGNPVEYDTLEAIDANKPSKNKNDPNQFIIPGYASGILQSHELPTRSNFNGETPRKIDDDRIHFIDPLQNAYQNSDKPYTAPSPSLSTPLGTPEDNANANNQQPINIPKPNIDLPETPQAPIDDPLNHVLTPPQDNSQVSSPDAPSFSLQVPNGNDKNEPQVSLTQGLIPPQIPSEGQTVFIPRPNIDVSETPIDSSNGPLNQGLLPPTDDFKAPNFGQSFSNPNQDGPIVIKEGEIHFAPKPSNGLLPPKDSLPNEIAFEVPTPQPTFSSVNKFNGPFGGSPGLLAPAVNNVANKFASPTTQTVNEPAPNKFTGSFGGAPGILGGQGPVTNRQNSNQIPVTVFHEQFSTNNFKQPTPTQNSFTQTPKVANNKYQGNFGGSPGVLVSNNDFDRASSIQGQSTVAIPSVSPTFATPSNTPIANKFTGSFGGAPGVLGENNAVTFSQAPTTTQTLSQLPNLNADYPALPKEEAVAQKYSGQFGGAPGILRPYDNSKN